MKEKIIYDREFKGNTVKLSYERGNVAILARENREAVIITGQVPGKANGVIVESFGKP